MRNLSSAYSSMCINSQPFQERRHSNKQIKVIGGDNHNNHNNMGNVIYGDGAHDRDPANPQQLVKYQIYILLAQSTREILF